MRETLQEPKKSPNHSFFDKEIVTKMNGFKIQNNTKFKLLILTKIFCLQNEPYIGEWEFRV